MTTQYHKLDNLCDKLKNTIPNSKAKINQLAYKINGRNGFLFNFNGYKVTEGDYDHCYYEIINMIENYQEISKKIKGLPCIIVYDAYGKFNILRRGKALNKSPKTLHDLKNFVNGMISIKQEYSFTVTCVDCELKIIVDNDLYAHLYINGDSNE